MSGLENLSVLAFMGVGHWELMALMVVVVLLFGHRLPSMMRSVGQGLKEFKVGMNEGADSDELPSGSA